MIPYRLDLAGGWLDQPFMSGLYPGSVITISLEPIMEYEECCGMATSTRRSILDLWGELPNMNPLQLSKIVFSYDNKPGTQYVSGAQDSIGICVPGLTKHHYDGQYWPQTIEICQDDTVLDWLEKHVFIQLTQPRPRGLDLLKISNISYDNVMLLAEATDKCWVAILKKNLQEFADAVTLSFEIQKMIFPIMNIKLPEINCMGYKLAGAGGGGYLVMINDNPCGDIIKIRRK
jgi:hypothetical protein